MTTLYLDGIPIITMTPSEKALFAIIKDCKRLGLIDRVSYAKNYGYTLHIIKPLNTQGKHGTKIKPRLVKIYLGRTKSAAKSALSDAFLIEKLCDYLADGIWSADYITVFSYNNLTWKSVGKLNA